MVEPGDLRAIEFADVDEKGRPIAHLAGKDLLIIGFMLHNVRPGEVWYMRVIEIAAGRNVFVKPIERLSIAAPVFWELMNEGNFFKYFSALCLGLEPHAMWVDEGYTQKEFIEELKSRLAAGLNGGVHMVIGSIYVEFKTLPDGSTQWKIDCDLGKTKFRE